MSLELRKVTYFMLSSNRRVDFDIVEADPQMGVLGFSVRPHVRRTSSLEL